MIITINRNGEKYQLQVPAGSHTVIDESGNATVNMPGKTQAGKTPTVTPAAGLNALLGMWKVAHVERERDSRVQAPWQLEGWDAMNPVNIDRLDFKEDALTIADFPKGVAMRYSYRVDPTAAPKTIDVLKPFQEIGVSEQVLAVGICEVDGERLKVRLRPAIPSLRTQPRPDRFAVEPGSGNVVLFLERYAVSQDEKAIRGWWSVVTQVDDGKRVPETEVRSRKFLFSDGMNVSIYENEAQLFGGSSAMGRLSPVTGLWLLDPATEPKTFTIFGFEPGNPRRTFSAFTGSRTRSCGLPIVAAARGPSSSIPTPAQA